jgi:YidC/Oxa1 family membrane protein insertase
MPGGKPGSARPAGSSAAKGNGSKNGAKAGPVQPAKSGGLFGRNKPAATPEPQSPVVDAKARAPKPGAKPVNPKKGARPANKPRS